MAVIAIASELDVIEKYLCLVKESLGSDSVYLRTKETLEDLFKNNNIKDTDKAKVIADVMGSLNSSLVNGSMSTALQWASAEKDVALKKLQLEIELDILAQEVLLKEAQVDKMGYESIAVQAQTKKVYGTPTVVDGFVTSLADDGKTTYEIALLDTENTNKGKEGILLDSKLNESFAAIHKVVADTYVNYGAWQYTLSSGGITSAPLDKTLVGYDTLSSVQKTIAKEQAKGYAYNAWGNALTGTSSMLGTAIASELTQFAPGGTGDTLINSASALTDKLGAVVTPY